MRKITTIIFTLIIGLSMTLAPSLAAEEVDITEAGYATEADEAAPAEEAETVEMPDINMDNAFEGLEGLNISDVENDP